MFNLLPVFSFIVFLTYLLYVWINFGIQKSFSKSYYVINKKIYFVLFSWLTAIPLHVYCNNLIMTLATVGMIIVGSVSDFEMDDDSSLYKIKLSRILHWGGAITAILFSEMYILFILEKYYLFYCFSIVLLLILLFKIKNKFWWIELFAYLNIYLSLLI